MAAVATRAVDEIIDERAACGAEARPGRHVRQELQIVVEACLGLGRCRRSVFAVGRVGQMVRDAAEDVGMALDAPGRSDFVPGRLECPG